MRSSPKNDKCVIAIILTGDHITIDSSRKKAKKKAKELGCQEVFENVLTLQLPFFYAIIDVFYNILEDLKGNGSNIAI